MPVAIELPVTFRPFANDTAKVVVEHADTLMHAVVDVVDRHPELHGRLVTSSGALYDFVGVFVNDRRVKKSDIPNCTLNDGDIVTFVPAMAGG